MEENSNTKATVIAGVDARTLSIFLILGALAVLTPWFIPAQWLSGPLVNFLLIIALFTVGLKGALVLCVVPSLLALTGGLIPVMLAPMLPFIMIGNMIFVKAIDVGYGYFQNNDRGYWTGLFAGAFLKFVFIYSGSIFIFALLIKSSLAEKAAQMMSWPQLLTALSGGMLAWLFLKRIKRI